mgnify:CR=1 FL=1|jgi:hypothetical protein
MTIAGAPTGGIQGKMAMIETPLAVDKAIRSASGNPAVAPGIGGAAGALFTAGWG